MNVEFYEKLEKSLRQINISITKEQSEKFYKYMKLLLEWNEKINLTAIVEQDEIILKHFIDSLTILKYLDNNKIIADVGTGAGFPGIPLAILNDTNKFTLIDSLNKRINFLNDVKEKLVLNNIENIHSRAEDFGQDLKNREQFDYAVSRAVANMSTLVEYLIPLVKIGGKIICMKGSQVEEELNNAKFAINELGGKIIKKEEIYLLETDIKRNIIIIEKIKETPKKYPRKSGVPARKPINMG